MLIIFSLEADNEIASSKEMAQLYKAEGEYHSTHAKVQNAQSTLEALFRRLQKSQNPPPDNKKYANFFVSLRMIQVEFKLNNFKHSDRFFKWIDTSCAQEFKLEMFPMKWRVMYAYFKGRLNFYRNMFPQARDELRFAFVNCHSDYPKNKKKILKYLAPVEMNLNKFPTKELLMRFQLKEYVPIVEACLDGDMVKFEKTIEEHMEYYVQGGVYMIIEKLRHLVLRNLIKKIEKMAKSLAIQKDPSIQGNDQSHQIKLEIVFNVVREWDDELDLDELECLIANLIYLGMIKGYISHEKRILVLAKQNAFPSKTE